ncbi:MAG TPA: hypothetical protein PKW24_06525 [Clostridiales bacterium]|nr:hypothetical protein [Clostridiales bacterium]
MKFNKIFWGIFLLVSAGIIIASQVTSFATVSVTSLIITMFLAAIIITSVVKLEYFGIFVPMAFLYMIYYEPLGLKPIRFWILILVSVLISGGFTLIFKKKRRISSYTMPSGHRVGTVSDSTEDNNPNVKVMMNSYSKFLRADNYVGGRFNVSLGNLELYFDNVNLSPFGATADIECNFATLKLYIPRHWNVADNVNSFMLGSIKNKTHTANPSPSAPILNLTGNVRFGSVEVNYI